MKIQNSEPNQMLEDPRIFMRYTHVERYVFIKAEFLLIKNQLFLIPCVFKDGTVIHRFFHFIELVFPSSHHLNFSYLPSFIKLPSYATLYLCQYGNNTSYNELGIVGLQARLCA